MSTSRPVEFQAVSKRYARGWRGGHVQAALDVSFHVEAGEVFGLLGPNRAGKTTLVKLLLGLCRPTAGQVTRLGRPTTDRSTLARVGYVHENPAFPRYLSAQAVMEFYGALSLLAPALVRQRVPQLLERVGLADRTSEPIQRFSKGMVQRLGLAQALLNEPELLVLDEPAEGLDLNGRRLVLDIIAERRSRGLTVLLVSHALADVAAICDRVGVMVEGKLSYLGPLAGLTGGAAPAAGTALEEALRPLYAGSSAAKITC
jgi:ABC-2 type transport system ATP-binding protein